MSYIFCLSRHVFEVYGSPYNASVNWGLRLPESDTLNLICEKWGDWTYPELPKCIRKTEIQKLYWTFSQLNIFSLAKNCTMDPFPAINTDRGKYDWNTTARIKSFGTVVKYWCPKNGWGFPSTGGSEIYSMCQADKTWNVTSVENCIGTYEKFTK